MSSTALKIMMAVMVVTAVVFGFFAYRLSQELSAPPPAPEPEPIIISEDETLAVVAIQPLKAFQPIPETAVALVPLRVLPDGHYEAVDEVIGKAPLQDINKGVPVAASNFRDSNSLVRSIPQGFQAVSLEINDVVAVGGFVQPGDVVDIMVYLRSDTKEVTATQSRVLLKQVRVLAYEERIINVPKDESEDGQTRRKRIRTAVVAIPQEDVTRVMLGASRGDLRLALIGVEDAEAPVEDEQVAEAAEAEQPAEGQKKADAEADEEGKLAERLKNEKVITLDELARVKKKEPEKKKVAAKAPPPRPSVYVYRGSAVQKVTP